ncbi:MAG: protein kinase, partial [Bacteroidaceae bacterium]|nr:protein kinase [Bacteroidaceae bacterium]
MKLKQDTVLKNGEYKIIKTLGQGGFGITYLAYQIHLKRNVVIKEFFIKEYCDRDSDTSKVFLGTSGNRDIVVRFLNKFHNEALNIAALKHPNIISIYDVFEENNTAYYVMEYHPNGSLGRLVDGHNGMSKERALHYIYQVADVLKYIHSKHIMHLDIKPDNILLDENDNAILIDFGLAKVYDGATNQQQTRSSSIAAYSPGYAPLEQYNPSGISSFSPTTDIYSLGATLFTLLTGKCPPLAIELINNDFIAQELLRYNVDKAIIDTIVRSMSPTTVQRPQSIGEFLAMLDAGKTAVPQPTSRIAPQPASQVAPQPASQVVPQPASQVNSKPKKPFNRKPLVGIIAAILCIIFAGVGINECNDYRDEQQRLAAIRDSIAAVKHYNDSIAMVKRYNDSVNNALVIKALEQQRLAAMEKARQDSIAAADKKRNVFETKIFNVNGIEFTMVPVDGGTFNMGSND